MFISKQLVEQYRRTHERKYGETISAKEAERNLSNLTEIIRETKKLRSKRHGK